MVKKLSLLIFMILLLVTGCGKTPLPESIQKYTGEVLITSCRQVADSQPLDSTSTFSVSEPAFIHACWQHITGTHETVAVFKDPRGEVRFPTQVRISSANGAAVTWYWLKISDQEPEWARGRWEAMIMIDGRLAGTAELFFH